MDNKEIVSPCMSVCKTDPISGFCYGCGRTDDDKNMCTAPLLKLHLSFPRLPWARSQQANNIPPERAGWNTPDRTISTPPCESVASTDCTPPRPFIAKCRRAMPTQSSGVETRI